MILTTFQKGNGQIIQRVRNTYPSYRIGDRTSMGWKVLDMKFKYKGKYYSRTEYDDMVTKSLKRSRRNTMIKNKLYSIYKELVYSIILLLFINFFKISLSVNL